MTILKSRLSRPLLFVAGRLALILSLFLFGCSVTPSPSLPAPQAQRLVPNGVDPDQNEASRSRTPMPAGTPLADGSRRGQAAKHDVSPALRDLKPLPMAERQKEELDREEREEERERQEREEEHERPQVNDPVVQSGPVSVAAVPAPIRNFDGIASGSGVLDPNGDIGPRHYVQMVNWSFQIWDKQTGASLYGPASNNTLWSGFGGPCELNNIGDPVVLYDHLADRWFLSQLAGGDTGGLCLAVSQTNDPTGSYHRYYFPMSNDLYDYPKFGVWPDAYYMTSHFAGGQAIVAFERDKMLTGQPASYHEFPMPGANTLTPADLDGYTLPPAGAPNYVGELDNTTFNRVKIWKVHIDWATPANSNVTGPTLVSVAPFTFGSRPAHLGGAPLWELADPLMFRLVYRNFGTYDMLLANHHVNAGSASGIRWYEIRNPGGTPVVFQQGTYAPDLQNRWVPSIAMDRMGNIMMGYSVVTSSTEPNAAYAGRLAGDPLGQMTQGESILATSTGTYTGERWGDYADMTVDPSDDCTFWFTTQYVNNSLVQSRIGSFKFPSCTAPTNVALNKTATGSTACAATETPAQAFDGSTTTKWCSLDASKSLQVDLGSTYNVTGFLIKHAGAGGEPVQWNTRDFNIQLSSNGTTWTTLANVTGNTASVTSHPIATTGARYVKLNVTTPTSDGDPAARIYELEVYGTLAGGTPTPTPTRTATPTPTRTPTRTPTPTPGTSGLKIQYAVGDPSSPNDNQIQPNFKIVNTGSSSVPLSELTIRYWYTRDTAVAQIANCDFFPPGCANVTTSFTAVSPARTGADYYYQIGFTSGAGSIAAGGNSGEIKTRFHKNDWSNYAEGGDYSYDATKTTYTDWSKVTLYRNGVLVWGTEP